MSIACDDNEKHSGVDILDDILLCGICSCTMLHPVIADCGHAIGCRACVETFFECNIANNKAKRKATRLRCKHCGEGFAKPRNKKKFCVDHTLGEVCRKLRPSDFGPGRASTAMDSLTMAVVDLKKRMADAPIAEMSGYDIYHRKLYEYLDNNAKGIADLHFCQCKNRVSGWPEGVPVYPKLSVKSNKWYLSCPMWTPTSKNDGLSCSYFQWVSAKDVERLGICSS